MLWRLFGRLGRSGLLIFRLIGFDRGWRRQRTAGANGSATGGVAAPSVNVVRFVERQANFARGDQDEEFGIAGGTTARAKSIAGTGEFR